MISTWSFLKLHEERNIIIVTAKVYNKEGGRVSYSVCPCVIAVVTVHNLTTSGIYVKCYSLY